MTTDQMDEIITYSELMGVFLVEAALRLGYFDPDNSTSGRILSDAIPTIIQRQKDLRNQAKGAHLVSEDQRSRGY